MASDVENKRDEVESVLDQVDEVVAYEEDIRKLEMLRDYLKPAIDGTFEELMPVLSCFSAIPDVYSSVDAGVFTTIDKLAQLLTAANDVGNLNMVEEHAKQIITVVMREREKREQRGSELICSTQSEIALQPFHP